MNETALNSVSLVPILEHVCEECSGTGCWVDEFDDGEDVEHYCSDCRGAGYVLTADGKRLLDFYRHHIARLLDVASSR